MAIDTTVHRDPETGLVMLTTEQAEVLALPLPVDVEDPYADLRAAIIDAGDVPYRALTRWVLLNAPVVRAAEIQERDSHCRYMKARRSDGERWRSAYMLSIEDVEAAVRAARGEGEATS